VYDAEFSTTKPLFEYDISILIVGANHLIAPKDINLLYQHRHFKTKPNKKEKKKKGKIPKYKK